MEADNHVSEFIVDKYAQWWHITPEGLNVRLPSTKPASGSIATITPYFEQQ